MEQSISEHNQLAFRAKYVNDEGYFFNVFVCFLFLFIVLFKYFAFVFVLFFF